MTDADKDKGERFRRVAAMRVQKVLDTLDSLAKCSNRNNYHYSDAEVGKMIRAIKSKLRDIEQTFGRKSGESRRGSFKF